MITVFTPTYNRAYIINNLYNSLLKQTNKGFEWLVVDDGSTDNTEELIKGFISDQKISIRYFKKRNGGKHTAINLGVQKALGELFFIVDSDDFLLEDAIESIYSKYEEIKFKDDLAGVSFRRGYDKEKLIGSPILFDDSVLSVFDFRYRKKVRGDQAEVYKTNVLKKYPFPEFQNEKFCPESLVWNRISDTYKVLWTSRIIYICNYLEDGLTFNSTSLRAKCPKAVMLLYSELEQKDIPIFYKVKANVNFWRFSFYSRISFFEKLKKVYLINSIIGLPIGFVFFVRDLWK